MAGAAGMTITPWRVLGVLCAAEAERLLCEAFFPRRMSGSLYLALRLCWYDFALLGLILSRKYMLQALWEMAGLYLFCSIACQSRRSRRFLWWSHFAACGRSWGGARSFLHCLPVLPTKGTGFMKGFSAAFMGPVWSAPGWSGAVIRRCRCRTPGSGCRLPHFSLCLP